MAATDQGLVHPVQKRLGPDDALYIAVRASGRQLADSKECQQGKFAHIHPLKAT